MNDGPSLPKNDIFGEPASFLASLLACKRHKNANCLTTDLPAPRL